LHEFRFIEVCEARIKALTAKVAKNRR